MIVYRHPHEWSNFVLSLLCVIIMMLWNVGRWDWYW